jgi:AsmA family protein
VKAESNPNKALRRSGIAAVVVAGLALLVVFFPWNLLRGPLAAYMSHRFDRAVSIDGDLSVNLGWTTRVQIDGLSIANVAWSNEQPMAASKRIVLWFTPGSLLRGEPVKAQLIDADVLLERNADGNDNWHLGTDAPAPSIGNIDIENSTIHFRDAKERADVKLQLWTITSAGEDPWTLRLRGQGTWHGDAVQIEGRGLGLAQLQDIATPYRLTLNIRAGGTSINFDGTVVPAETENLRGALRLQGPDLSLLYPLVPAPLPWTPPYNLAGELVHTKGRGLWELLGMKGTVGESDLKGDVRIDVSKPRSLLTADLTSARFDSKDLGGIIGLPPGDPANPAQTAEQRAEERRRVLSYRVLPDKPLELAKLREHDAEVNFRGTSVKWSALPLDNLSAHLKLKDGVLTFEPLDFGIADGHVIANGQVDATQGTAKAHGEFEARNVELKRLFPKLASPKGTAGRFGGRAHFKTQGNTVAAMLAAADGDAAVIMRGGEASTLQLVLTNLDLARAAQLLLRGDETAEIRCAVGSLHAKGGIMTPDLFEVDTSAVVISGEGNVDFRDEKYDLTLKARSKRPSLLALRGPIVIGGTFKAPMVGPAIGPVATRVGAAVGLGIVAPPLALIPLIDFGNASDLDCKALMEQARIPQVRNVSHLR